MFDSTTIEQRTYKQLPETTLSTKYLFFLKPLRTFRRQSRKGYKFHTAEDERKTCMYRLIQDFIKDWKYENEATVKVFKNLTDASLNQKVKPDGRSLGFLAWHIVISLGEMGGKVGLNIDAPEENTPVPTQATDIVAAYEKAGSSIAEQIRQKWTDEMLLDEVEMYGEKWTRGATLSSLRAHQIHHRAQMTILMRQAGLFVPGIYGPSREEWSELGMKAPE